MILSRPVFHSQQHWTEIAHWITQQRRPSVQQVLEHIFKHKVRIPSKKMASKDSAMILPRGSRRAPFPYKEFQRLKLY